MTWWDDYNRYLASPQWQRKRQRVLERDSHRCQAQLDGCTGRATEAHHRGGYRYVQNEPLFELIALCHHCHDQITQMDRARRAAAKHGGLFGLFRGKR